METMRYLPTKEQIQVSTAIFIKIPSMYLAVTATYVEILQELFFVHYELIWFPGVCNHGEVLLQKIYCLVHFICLVLNGMQENCILIATVILHLTFAEIWDFDSHANQNGILLMYLF